MKKVILLLLQLLDYFTGGHGTSLFLNLLLILLGSDGLDFHTIGEFGDTVGDILVAHVQATGNDVAVAIVLRIDRDFGVFHLVILAQHIDKLLVLHLADNALRNNDRLAVGTVDYDGARTAGLEQTLRIAEVGNHLNRTRSGIHHTAGFHHAAFMAVFRTISQQEFH